VILRFGRFEIDDRLYRLRCNGVEVTLQRKTFDAIQYLAENSDRVVLKEELLEVLWPGEHVNSNAVPWTLSRARKALGQLASNREPIETIRGRGYRLAVPVRKCEEAHGPASELRSVATTRPSTHGPFVGRTEPMARLVTALGGARAGLGRFCLVTGEAGIGKSRCVAELSSVAHGLGVQMSTGRCLEGAQVVTFWPWLRILHDVLASAHALRADIESELRALLEEIDPRSGSSVDRAITEGDLGYGKRLWLVEGLSRTLIHWATKTPCMIVLEDLHWADQASLDLLNILSAEVTSACILLVGTARSEQSGGPWGKLVPCLRPNERIELSALKRSDIERYVTEVTGLGFSSDIHDAVAAKCGGNPLFLQETVRLLLAQSGSRGADALSALDITVPTIVTDVARARLSGLPEIVRETVEAAAVIGHEFELSLLQSTLGISHDVLAQLDEAARALLVSPKTRPGTYRFLHETIREAIYESLPAGRRAVLHERIAEAIEARASEVHLNELAYHYYRGLPRTDPARAERYLRAAGESALRRLAYEEASTFLRWALEARQYSAEIDDRAFCELQLALAGALRMSGQLTEARECSRSAIAIASRNGLADLLWAASRGLRPSMRAVLAPDALALSALQEAERLLGNDQRSLRVRILAELACIPPHSLSTKRCDALSAAAVELARETGDRADLAYALRSRIPALSGPNHIDELLALTVELLQLDPDSVAEVEEARYRALLHRGEVEQAEAVLESYGRVARRLRRPELIWHYQRLGALRRYHVGDFEHAASLFSELFEQSHRLRFPYHEMYVAVHTAMVAHERDSSRPSGAYLGSEFTWASPIPTYQAHRLRHLVDRGHCQEARLPFRAIAEDGFSVITQGIGYLNALSHLSVVAVSLADRERAEMLYSLLATYPHHNTPNGFGYCLGSVSFFLGKLARFLGRTRIAISHFEDALARNQRMGYLPAMARTQAALGDLLADGERRSEHQRASALLSEAAGTSGALHMHRLGSEIERSRTKLHHASG
jgi:DNA-binding winged helix-turn-helix (wHTH) protein/tetratricopeptide (TPR) repeat protein